MTSVLGHLHAPRLAPVTADESVRQTDPAACAAALVRSLGHGDMEGVAYDTAWVARLADAAGQHESRLRSLAGRAQRWLLAHQWPDGSWGGRVENVYDRVVSTLASAAALGGTGPAPPASAAAIARACAYLRAAVPCLEREVQDTVAFELIAPGLLGELRERGLPVPAVPPALRHAEAHKRRLIGDLDVYAPDTPLSFSLEMLGPRVDCARATRLLGEQGVAASPAATAFLLLRCPGLAAAGAVRYLEAAATPDGSLPTVYPFRTFEAAWVLFHLALAGMEQWRHAAALERLRSAWHCRRTAWSDEVQVQDADELAVVFALLARAGEQGDPARFAPYERATHFACFEAERSPSVTANAHLLYAFRRADPFPARERWLAKTSAFLRETQDVGGFWLDKWHVSPYYATSRAIIALHRHEPERVDRARRWILDSQHANGLWGAGGGTAEETAYAVHGLLYPVLSERGGGGPWSEPGRLTAALCLFERALVSPGGHPELWVAKALFAPTSIVRSAIIAAAQLARRADARPAASAGGTGASE